MSKIEMTEELKLLLQAEADEYAKSFEFGLDMQDMEYRLKFEGKEVSSEDLAKMVKEQFIQQRCNEIYCEKNGHTWQETNADAENGTSDLECEVCGEHHTLQW